MKFTKATKFGKKLRIHMALAIVCIVLSLFGETLGVVTMFVGLVCSDRFCVIAGLFAILCNVWWYICANRYYNNTKTAEFYYNQHMVAIGRYNEKDIAN